MANDLAISLGVIAALMTGMAAGFALASRRRSGARNSRVRQRHPEGDDVCRDFSDSDKAFKMVMVVRSDLKMGKGKIAAQCGHAVLGAYESAHPNNLKAWYRRGCAKIAVKCDGLEDLHRVEEACEAEGLNSYVVCDAGRTQVEPNTLTVCGIGPGPVDVIDRISGQFKLL